MASSGDEEVSTERAAREAAAWFVRLRNPMASAADRRGFRDWLAADPAHGRAMSEVETLWKDLDAPAAALAAEERLGRPAVRRLPGRRRAAAALAALAAVLATALCL